jgi:hypothetical protein
VTTSFVTSKLPADFAASVVRFLTVELPELLGITDTADARRPRSPGRGARR